MELKPSLSDLRGKRYCIRTSHSGISHSRNWERGDINKQHTLRVDNDFLTFLKKKTGPKRRRTNRVIGKTPDDSYVRRGRRTSGYPHQLRSHINRFFAAPDEYIKEMLERNVNYKPGKKKAVGIVMPNLEKAIDELYFSMIKENSELRQHEAFKRRWAPAICRLIEIHWKDQEAQKKIKYV